MTTYNLSWQITHTPQNIIKVVDKMTNNMIDDDYYWDKIDEILKSPESDQYLASLGIDITGKSQDTLAEEIASCHFRQLNHALYGYFEEICDDFKEYMTLIFSNEIITYTLDAFEVNAVDYKDKTSVSLDFAEDIDESQITQFIQKVFERNREAYDPDYNGDFHYEISCSIIGNIPFRLNSREAYKQIIKYLLIEPEVKEVKED